MKTAEITMIALASLLLGATACNKEIDLPQESLSNSFTATIPVTKVVLASDFTMSWEAGDSVSVFDGTATATYKAETAGATTVLSNSDITIDPALSYYAAYPVKQGSVFANDGVTITIPAIQHLSQNPFEFSYGVAKTTGAQKSFAFHNVAALIAFEITESNVNNVAVSADGGECLTGKVKVNYDDASFTFISGNDGASIILASDDSFTPGRYYAAVLPQTFTKGLTITISKKDGSRTQRHIKAFTLPRSSYIDLEQFDASRSWGKDITISSAAELQSFLLAAPTCGGDVTASLACDIDLNGVTLEHAASYAGTFNGNGHALRNWKTSEPLFTTLSGSVDNLVIGEGSQYTVSPTGNEAFIAGENSGTVSNCVSNGSIISANKNFSESRGIGAIVGTNTGTVTNCTNNGSIDITVPGHYMLSQWLGGVVGKTSSTDNTKASVKDCTNNGAITYTTGRNKSANFIGGVVGGTPANTAVALYGIAGLDDYGIINGCVNNADITVGFTENCEKMANLNYGGVVGYVEGSVTNCTNTAGKTMAFVSPMEGSYGVAHCSIGGVAGFVEYSMTGCSNGAAIDIDGIFTGGGTNITAGSGYYTACFFGGVAGSAGPNTGDSIIENCANTGSMNLDGMSLLTAQTRFFIAGVAAYSKAPMASCTNSGDIDIRSTAQYKFIGGIAGQSSFQLENCSNTGNLSLDNILTAQEGTTDKRNTGKIYLGGVSGFHAAATATKTLALNNFKILNCANAGNISIANGCYTTVTNYIGGIAGESLGEIRGDATTNATAVEGFGARNTGDITITAPGKFYLGGICGTISCKILYAMNAGAITISGTGCQSGSMIGGIAGTTEYRLSESLDGGDAAYYGVTDGNCGYVASNIGNITVKEASGQSGIGLCFGKINGTGSQTIGSITKVPQWHSSRVSGNLTVDGDTARCGVISGGGVAKGLSFGLSKATQKIILASITLNGTVINSTNFETNMGQNMVKDTNVLLTYVTYE